MKIIYTILSILLFTSVGQAQRKYLTKQGQVSFFSSTPVEDIKADNNQVLSVLNSDNGQIAIAILMKSFSFEKSLMQEHFNENYVESDVYPKAMFKGNVQDFKNFNTGKHQVEIIGDLTIHGVTQKKKITATFVKTENAVALEGEFMINILEFGIDIPAAIINNIAKEVLVSFELDHKPYGK